MTQCTNCDADTNTTVHCRGVFDVVETCDGCEGIVAVATAKE